MNKSKRRINVIVLLLGAMLLAACGNAEPVAEPAPEAEAEAAGGEGSGGGDSGGGEASAGGGSAAAREGYTAYASREELLEAAQNESGTLLVSMSHDQEVIDQLMDLFMQEYDFVDALGQEIGGSEQRVVLELQAGTHASDIVHIEEEDGLENYWPHLAKMDFAAMSEAGVVDIPIDMVNPAQPEAVAVGTTLGGISYNSDLLPEDLVPESYDDLLDPELKDSGLLWADVSSSVNLAALHVVWGEEEVIEYARALGEQNPVWTSGNTASVTAMAAGEFAVGSVNHYHSPLRLQDDAPQIEVVLVEPIPVRLTQMLGINATTEMPATSVLVMEFLAGLEAQEVYNEEGPMQGSIFREGSATAELTEGKEIAFVDWESIDNLAGIEERISEAWGFPTATVGD